MIEVECNQGSREWTEARLGIPTASQAYRLITPKTRKPSSQQDGYINDLLVEMELGEPADAAISDFMQRGHDLEPQAIKYYEFLRDVNVRRPGFIHTDDRTFGCSPDFLVGEDGGGEIKTPSASNHMAFLRGRMDDKYVAQMQSSMWVTGRAWWDFISWNPVLPPVVRRYHRDDIFIAQFAKIVAEFTALLRGEKARIEGDGHGP